jgi:hypothetical protein
MKAMTKTLAIVMIAALVIPGLIMAQAKGPGEKVGAGKKEVVKLKYVNIQDEINPDYNYLANIGSMIDDARHLKDGNSMLASALLLIYAEKNAGKKSASITGEALVNEAGDIAKEQKNVKLAKAVSDIYGDMVFGLGNKAKADEFTKLAKEYDAVAATTRGYGWVKITNESAYFVDIYIDGYYKGRLYSGYYAYYKIWEGTTKLYAEAPYTEPYNWYWGPKWVDLYEDETYEWTITE